METKVGMYSAPHESVTVTVTHRPNLFGFEFDTELLEMADDDDFRQVIPQEFSQEKKMLLLKASKNIRGRKVRNKNAKTDSDVMKATRQGKIDDLIRKNQINAVRNVR